MFKIKIKRKKKNNNNFHKEQYKKLKLFEFKENLGDK